MQQNLHKYPPNNGDKEGRVLRTLQENSVDEIDSEPEALGMLVFQKGQN